MFGLDKETAANTSEFNNLVMGSYMGAAKDLFGARVTNYEEQLLQKLSPQSGLTPEARKAILRQAIKTKQHLLRKENERRNSMKTGDYFAKGQPPESPDETYGGLLPSNESADTTGAIPATPASTGGASIAPGPTAAAPTAQPTAFGISGPNMPGSSAGQPSASQERVLVNSPEEARKLPPGTLFVTPDGRRGSR